MKSPPSEADVDKSRKRIMQANNKAEKSTLLFGVDIGEVPTINKEMLARKLTLDILYRPRLAPRKPSTRKNR